MKKIHSDKEDAHIEKHAKQLYESGFGEYLTYLKSPYRVLSHNLLAGIARGFGIVIGASLVVALVTLIIGSLTGIPIIGVFFEWMRDNLSLLDRKF